MYSKIFNLEANLLKAIAHPSRIEILRLLRDQELCVSDIHTMLDLPQANISQHLMLLKSSEILQARKSGKKVYYSITDKRIITVLDTMRDVLIEKYKDSSLADELTISMKDLVPVTHDPVCQMRVSPKTASYATKHDDHNYYFCASGCYKAFLKSPNKYIKE